MTNHRVAVFAPLYALLDRLYKNASHPLPAAVENVLAFRLAQLAAAQGKEARALCVGRLQGASEAFATVNKTTMEHHNTLMSLLMGFLPNELPMSWSAPVFEAFAASFSNEDVESLWPGVQTTPVS